jgi:ABC-type sugar transport system substrate-binding protein
MKKRIAAAILAVGALALAAAAAGVFTARSSGAANAQRTIGLVLPDPNGGAPYSRAVEPGASAAASALGDHLVVIPADGPDAMTSAVKSLIAQHAAAIIVNTDQGPATVKAVLPALAQARAAGIPTLSYEQRWPGSVWVTASTPEQYAQALTDGLASQMKDRGQYAIVPCRPAESIVQTWTKSIEAYVPQRYPGMKRVAVVYGDTGNGTADVGMFKRLIKGHPHLGGMIFVCPGESYILPPQVISAHRVGKVFSVGNGGTCPPLSVDLARYVRRGAEEIVCAGDPVKLGYLVVWAADYLASGHTFAPGSVNVGDPVGTVQYYSQNEELGLGQPITITKANLGTYSG